jgi:hypothetical protein
MYQFPLDNSFPLYHCTRYNNENVLKIFKPDESILIK